MPSLVRVSPGAAVEFQLDPLFDGPISWSMDEPVDATGRVGRIDESGHYTAPKRPRVGEVIVRARLPQRLSLRATILLHEQPLYRHVAFWDKKGEGEGFISEAHAVCLDPDGNVLIADPRLSCILRYTPEGTFIDEIGRGKGSGPGELDGPRDVKTDRAGNVYVADGNNGRLQIFSGEGDLVSICGCRGEGPSEFIRPHSLDLGPEGCIYTVDVDNSKVAVHEPDGTFLRSWGKPGKAPSEFWAPHGLAVDPNGDVFVADYYGRVQKFTSQGDYLFSFANPSNSGFDAHGYYRYHAMTGDNHGNVYLMARNTLDKFSMSVEKYNNEGDLVTSLRSPIGQKRILGVEAATVSSSGRVFVADSHRDHAGISIFDPI